MKPEQNRISRWIKAVQSGLAAWNRKLAREIRPRIEAETELVNSEEKFRLVFESANVGKSITLPTGEINVNQALCDMLGYTREELKGKKWQDITPPDEFETTQKPLDLLLQGKKDSVRFNKRYIHKNGSYIDTDVSTVIHRDIDRKPLFFITTVIDITDRKKAEEEVHLAYDRLRRFIDSNIVGVVIASADGKVIETNDYYLHMIGFTRDEFESGKVDWRAITPPEWLPADEKAISEMREHGSCTPYEKEYIRRDGTRVAVFLSDTILPGPEEQIAAFALDITERKQAEDKLRESERKLREVQEMAHLGSWYWDVKTGDVVWSEEVYKIFCLDPKTFTPHIDSILALSPWPEDHQRDKELINRAIETHSNGSYEQKFLRPDQSIGYYYSTFQGNYDTKGDLVSIIGTVMDITERKRVVEALQESEQRIRTFLDATSDMVFLKDESFHHIIANSSLCKFYGKAENEIVGKTDFDLMTEKSASECKKTDEQTLFSNALLITEEVVGGRYYETMKFPVELAEGKKGIGAYIRDITERKWAEERLRESEIKLRAILESTADGILVVDNNGKVIKTNKRFADLWLIPQSLVNSGDDEALLTFVLDQLIEPAQFIDKVHKLYGSTEEDLDMLFFKDGRILERFSTAFLLNDSNIGRVWSFRDVTDRKRAEEEKKRSRNLIVETQRIAKLGGWEYDTATRSVTWTDEVYRIYGVSSDYDPSHPEDDIQFYAPEDQKKITDAFQRAVEVGEPYDLELQLINGHGEKLWIRTVGQVEHKEGKIIRVFGNIIDITEHKRVEEEVRRLNEDLEQRINERTTELRKTIAQLEEVNRTFVGRELRMIELKERIAELEKK